MELTELGKYKIQAFIGQGAMGRVYKAHDPVLNRLVAIKTITSTVAGDADLRVRFHREAQAAARLNHPNIITVYDYGEEGETIYIAMELLEGTDLKDLLIAGTLTSLSAKLRIIEQICDGLAFAHSKGVIHRDLKPANVHVTPTGQVKIMDFGLARLDSGDRSKAGVVVGTPNYMSPEQAMGDEIDARTDIFSAGAVFYELLANRKPFDADSVHGILFQVVHKQPTPVREISRELPPIVAEVVEKALAKDRAKRFQSASDFREALSYVEHALASGRPQEARLSRSGDKTLLPATAPSAPRVSPVRPTDPIVEGTVALDMRAPDAHPVSRPASLPSGRGSASRPPSLPRTVRPSPPPRRRSTTAIVLGTLIGIAGVAGAYLYMGRQAPKPAVPPAGTGSTARLDALTQALVSTKLELARTKLQDKDYRAALGLADEAVRLLPTSAEAKAVRVQAQDLLKEVEAAASEAKAAVQEGDNERASAALSKLLSLDPRHPAALDVSGRLNSSFRRQAEDARALAEESRTAALRAGARKNEMFLESAALIKEAEGRFSGGSFADATRGFLEARDGFDSARRAMATPAPTTPPPAETARAARAVPPAETAVTQPPTQSPPPSVTTPAVPRRAFVVGKSIVQSRPAGSGLAGFEGASVRKATDFDGRIDIELGTSEVRPGDAYTIRATFTNLARKNVKIHDATATFTANGQARVETLMPQIADVAPQRSIVLTDTGGIWDDGIETWSLEVSVTLDKGDICKREVKLK